MLSRLLRIASFTLTLFVLLQASFLSTAGQSDVDSVSTPNSAEEKVYLPLVSEGSKSSPTPQPSSTPTPIPTPSPTPISTTLPITFADVAFLSERWYLVNVGQLIGGKITGTVGADVRAPLAWSLTQGISEVVVAILDTGIAFNHPDLANKIWINSKETLNGQDDDGNGYIDDWRGWDFISDDNDPQDSRIKILGDAAELFHGTAVASLITSLAPKVRIMPLRVVGGLTSDEKFAQAVIYARDNGAHVVNMSFASGGFVGLPKLRAAIESSPDLLFIAAAGNDANNTDILKPEPCVLPLPNVICVTSTDEHDNFAHFQVRAGPNYGVKTILMAAPGTNMLVAQQPITTTYHNGFEEDQLSSWQQSGELGNNWTFTSEISRTGSISLRYLRPSANTVSGQRGAIRMANPIDLAGRYGCWLDGWVRSDIDKGYLFDIVTWTSDNQYFYQGFSLVTSTNGEWKHFMVSLSREEAIGKLYIGFSLYEGFPGNSGALYIDDLRVTCNSNSFGERDYGYVEGTSFSAPLVAGAAALAFSYRPESSVEDIETALLVGGIPSASLYSKTIAPVRLDAYNTLLALDLLANDTSMVSMPKNQFALSKYPTWEQRVLEANEDRLEGDLLLNLILPEIVKTISDIEALVVESLLLSEKNNYTGDPDKVCSDPVAMNNLNLASGNVSEKVQSALDKLGVKQQKIGTDPLCPGCPLSFDKYTTSFKVSGENPVTVDQLFTSLKTDLPSGIMSNGLSGSLMKTINTFEHTEPDVLLGNRSPTEGDLIHIEIAPPEPFGGDVVIAEINDTDPNNKSFTVITVDNPNPSGGRGHPVSGARVFGVMQVGDRITVYTQGADSPGNKAVLTGGSPVQKVGWGAFQRDIRDQVNNGEIPGASDPQITNDLQVLKNSPNCGVNAGR